MITIAEWWKSSTIFLIQNHVFLFVPLLFERAILLVCAKLKLVTWNTCELNSRNCWRFFEVNSFWINHSKSQSEVLSAFFSNANYVAPWCRISCHILGIWTHVSWCELHSYGSLGAHSGCRTSNTSGMDSWTLCECAMISYDFGDISWTKTILCTCSKWTWSFRSALLPSDFAESLSYKISSDTASIWMRLFWYGRNLCVASSALSQ